MNQFDDDREELEVLDYLRSLTKRERQARERLRQIGYSEYDRLSNRIRRSWFRLTGQTYISRESWNQLVDKQIDK